MWSIVQPSYWHPISALEQSLSDFEILEDIFPPSTTEISVESQIFSVPESDVEFFRDIPLFVGTSEELEKPEETKKSAEPSHEKEKEKQSEEATKLLAQVKEQDTESRSLQAQMTKRFSTYSVTHSTVWDDNGQVVESIRRRFEDSSGFLKAECKKIIGNKTAVVTWKRENKSDEGTIQQMFTNSSAENFDSLWVKTPFGKMEKEQLETLKSKGEMTKTASQPETEPGVSAGCQCGSGCKCRSGSKSEAGKCTCVTCGQVGICAACAKGEETPVTEVKEPSGPTLETKESTTQECSSCGKTCACRNSDEKCPCPKSAKGECSCSKK